MAVCLFASWFGLLAQSPKLIIIIIFRLAPRLSSLVVQVAQHCDYSQPKLVASCFLLRSVWSLSHFLVFCFPLGKLMSVCLSDFIRFTSCAWDFTCLQEREEAEGRRQSCGTPGDYLSACERTLAELRSEIGQMFKFECSFGLQKMAERCDSSGGFADTASNQTWSKTPHLIRQECAHLVAVVITVPKDVQSDTRGGEETTTHTHTVVWVDTDQEERERDTAMLTSYPIKDKLVMRWEQFTQQQNLMERWINLDANLMPKRRRVCVYQRPRQQLKKTNILGRATISKYDTRGRWQKVDYLALRCLRCEWFK